MARKHVSNNMTENFDGKAQITEADIFKACNIRWSSNHT